MSSRVKMSSRVDRKQIVVYLKAQMKKRKHFFKSKVIGQDLGLTAKEVGTSMGLIAVEHPELHIEAYSYSRSTTWKVTLTKENQNDQKAVKVAA